MFRIKLLFFVCLLAFISSCNNNKPQQDEKEQSEEQISHSASDISSNKDNSVSSDSEDWDALLDSYESYVNKYISYMKKAAKGDMNALAEYPALMQNAQEYCDRMSDAEGNMSPSQWSRYIEITNKLTQAAAELQQVSDGI